MKIEKTHIDQIRKEFKQMQSREELLSLLNYAKPLIYGDKTIPFQLKQLTFYANPNRSKNFYKEFKIKKKSGADRTIHAPQKGLKALQKTLSFIMQCVFEPHKAAMGFVRDKSIVDNAKRHEGSLYVYNIDLKDFFLSIDQARVWKCLQLKPFNLIDFGVRTDEENLLRLKTGVRTFITEHKEIVFYKIERGSIRFIPDKKNNFKRYKERIIALAPKTESLTESDVLYLVFEDAKQYIFTDKNTKQLEGLISSRKNLANIIASLCCAEMKVERKNKNGKWEIVKRNVLPQGASTSPVLTNVVCQRLDFLLTGVANRFGLRYSRYADDITFSSMHNVYQNNSEFLNELQRIITDQGFHIKESKTRLQKHGFRQEVTGLVINDKTNVQKRYIKQLRMWLYYWERYGYGRASMIFSQQYIDVDKGRAKNAKPNMASVIRGKLDYLKMVKGADNALYLKLRNRFNQLPGKEDSIDKILNTWETQGIEKAIIKYKTIFNFNHNE